MDDRLVTLAAFLNTTEAYLAQSKLESEGIDVFVFDDKLVGVNWLYSNAVGGVKLKVKESDARRAMEALREDLSYAEPPTEMESLKEDISEEAPSLDEETPEPQSAPSCPRCLSPAVVSENFSRRIVFLSWLLLGFPLPLLRRRWFCQSCGHRWKRR
jgi:hypothetical protein